MTDDDFQDQLIIAKSRLIQGATEKTIRLEFAARGITGDDLERIIGGLDFSRQSAERRRDRRYRIAGGIIASIGVVWFVLTFYIGRGSVAMLQTALALTFVGLWLLGMGERALFRKRPRRDIRIGRRRDR